MKKDLVMIMLMSLAMHGCDHDYCEDSGVYLYKFEGEDYANNVCVDGRGRTGELVPCKLHNGYYYGGNVGVPEPDGINVMSDGYGKWTWLWDVYYLSFTYDDMDAGRAPADWRENWRNYVIAHTPYAEVYTGPWNCSETGAPTGKKEQRKFECNDNSLRKHAYFRLDTAKVNKIIDKGEMDKRFIRINVIKTPDSL